MFTKVEMFIAHDYFERVKQVLQVSADLTAPASNEDTARILLVSQQTVSRDGNLKGEIFYESPYVLISRSSKITQIEHMGLLVDGEQTGESNTKVPA